LIMRIFTVFQPGLDKRTALTNLIYKQLDFERLGAR